MVLRSRSLWDQDLEPTENEHVSPTGKAIKQRGPNNSSVYVMEREVRFDGAAAPHVFRLAVALDTKPADRLRQSFSRNVEVALGVIGLVLFGGAWLQASVGLLPLKRLRGELAKVHAASRIGCPRRSRSRSRR